MIDKFNNYHSGNNIRSLLLVSII